MPLYTLKSFEIEINRRAVLLDTNVLVGGFCSNDGKRLQQYIRYFLEESDVPQFLIPSVVIVESWGLIVGKHKEWESGRELLAWINTPGNRAFIFPQTENLQDEHSLVAELMSLKIDYVDSVIYTLASKISTICKLEPPLAVATYDTRDFYNLKSARPNLKCELYDDLPYT